MRRTNPGNRCAACAARVSQEHPIPQSFWYADDLAAALAQWDLPAVVRLVHKKLGLTQVTLANLTGYSQAHISRWLRRDVADGLSAYRTLPIVQSFLADFRESTTRIGGRPV